MLCLKKKHGGDHGNQYTKVAKGNNYPLPNTAQKVAKEHNVSEKTIKNDAEYARAVDTGKNIHTEARESTFKNVP